jgi:hypothetical protein
MTVMMLMRQTAGAFVGGAASVFIMDGTDSLGIFPSLTAERTVTTQMEYPVSKRDT